MAASAEVFASAAALPMHREKTSTGSLGTLLFATIGYAVALVFYATACVLCLSCQLYRRAIRPATHRA